MPPTDERFVPLRREHRVGHQNGCTARKGNEPVAPAGNLIVFRAGAQLVVRYIDESPPSIVTAREPIRQRAPRMPDGHGRHVIPSAMPLFLRQLLKVDPRLQLLEAHREHHGRHLVPYYPLDARLERLRAPAREMIPLAKQRRDERNTMNVMPMPVLQNNVIDYR